MLARLTIASLAFVLVALPAQAVYSDEGYSSASVAGKYRVKFEEVQNSCTNTGINLNKATIEITKGKRRRIDVTIPMVPLMKGVASRGGKFKAKAKIGRTAIQGVRGKFSVSGRVSDDVIQMVFVAQYFRGKEPLCTQSWNATGLKN